MTVTGLPLRSVLLVIAASGFLDSYTYLVRGHVFANTQTGNVVLLGISAAEGEWSQVLAHLWPILAFVAGVLVGAHLQSGRLDGLVRHPLRAVVGLHALILVVIGFVPESVPAAAATIPIAFMSATQVEQFRTVGSGMPFFALATTGNLMRFVEAGYGVADRDEAARTPFAVYGWIVAVFAVSALVGGVSALALGARAAWVPAGLLAAMVVIDARGGRRPAVRP